MYKDGSDSWPRGRGLCVLECESVKIGGVAANEQNQTYEGMSRKAPRRDRCQSLEISVCAVVGVVHRSESAQGRSVRTPQCGAAIRNTHSPILVHASDRAASASKSSETTRGGTALECQLDGKARSKRKGHVFHSLGSDDHPLSTRPPIT